MRSKNGNARKRRDYKVSIEVSIKVSILFTVQYVVRMKRCKSLVYNITS